MASNWLNYFRLFKGLAVTHGYCVVHVEPQPLAPQAAKRVLIYLLDTSVLNAFMKIALLVLLQLMAMSAMALEIPPGGAPHETSADDKRAIQALLDTYTHAVSTGDEAAFSQLLLNEQIPFFATDRLAQQKDPASSLATNQYAGFRNAVFRSHAHLTQRFYNVHIEQDAELANVSLDFVTLDTQTKDGCYGWKTLQLIKVNHTWKIASEFFSVYALHPTADGAAKTQR